MNFSLDQNLEVLLYITTFILARTQRATLDMLIVVQLPGWIPDYFIIQQQVPILSQTIFQVQSGLLWDV